MGSYYYIRPGPFYHIKSDVYVDRVGERGPDCESTFSNTMQSLAPGLVLGGIMLMVCVLGGKVNGLVPLFKLLMDISSG